jgi:sugar diacid utilization regulator
MSYMDELTANSLEGFAREAAATQGARARARQALLDALLDGDAEARALEAAAGWAIPERVRVAVLLAAETSRLDDRALLLGRAGGVAVAVAAAGSEALAHTPHAAGPEVDAGAAAVSLRGARRLAELVVAGVLPGDRPLRWDDHLADLVVHADAAAAQALAARRLAPLADPSPARETLLRETLAAWLDHPGRPREIARDLHLHHQTVRYRLARLRERLGDALDDPQARFELQLALRASATASPTPARS